MANNDKLTVIRTLDAPEREEHVPLLPRLGDWYWVDQRWGIGWDAAISKAHLKDLAKDGRLKKVKAKAEAEEEETESDDDDAKSFSASVLMVVTQLGSNYVELSTPKLKRKEDRHEDPTGWVIRVHIDHMEHCTREPNPGPYIMQKTNAHRANVALLLGEIQELTSQLGVGQQALGTGDATSTANATASLVRVTSDQPVKAFKDALVKAKSKTLPELFDKVSLENRFMAMWMTAELMPMRAQAAQGLQPIIEKIDNRIFNVELYAGLVETVKVVKEGEPAHIAEPVHLMQRLHYMDEEFLAGFDMNKDWRPAAGGARGIDARNVDDFDAWLARPENLERLLPFQRTVLAFTIRRFDAEYHFEGGAMSSFIDFSKWVSAMKEANRKTFLYMRNGQRLYRLEADIKLGNGKEKYRRSSDDDDALLGEELFPDEKLRHLTGTLYAKVNDGHVLDVITKGDWETRHEKYEELKRTLGERTKQAKAARAAWKHERRLFIVPERSQRSYDDWDFSWDSHAHLMRRLLLAEGFSEEEVLKIRYEQVEVPKDEREPFGSSHRYEYTAKGASKKLLDALPLHKAERTRRETAEASLRSNLFYFGYTSYDRVEVTETGKARLAAAGLPSMQFKRWHDEYKTIRDSERGPPKLPAAPVDESLGYEPFEDSNVFYDEIQKWLAQQRDRHNRLVLILQGLLDRSETFHPHPKWELWTEVGFNAALQLHYDNKRALSATELPIDWEKWKAEKNRALKPGSVVAGARFWWLEDIRKKRSEMTKEERNRYSSKETDENGPSEVARVVSIRKGRAYFKWTKTTKFGGHWESTYFSRRRWVTPEPRISNVTWSVEVEKLLCLDNYQPGEMKQFFNDPRTRLHYAKWAPYLLTAEAFSLGKIRVTEPKLQEAREPTPNERNASEEIDALENDDGEEEAVQGEGDSGD